MSKKLLDVGFTGKKGAFIAALSDCGNVTRSAEIVGISRMTAYNWRIADEKFKKAWEKAEEIAAGLLEEEAWRRAKEGVDKPVYQSGMLVGYVREYGDTLLIFLLKGLKPERYREKFSHELGGPGGGPIKIDDARSEISRRIAELAARAGVDSDTEGPP